MGACTSKVGPGFDVASAFIGSSMLQQAFPDDTENRDLGVNTAKLTGCDKSASSLIKATNQLITSAIVRSVSKCDQQTTLVQDLSVSCDPKMADDSFVYEDNAACTACLQSVRLDLEERDRLERARWQRDPANATVSQSKDAMYGSLLRNLETCGLSVCKACVLLNVTQKNVFDGSMGCIQASLTKTAIISSVETLVRQQLLSNQDVLSAALTTLGVDTLDKVVQDIKTKLEQNVSSEFVTTIRQAVSSSQTIRLVSDTSIKTNVFSQNSIATAVDSLVTNENVALKAIGQASFNSMAKIINEQNTLNDLGQVIFASTVTFAKAIDSTVGLVMFGVLGVLGVIVIGVLIFVIYRIVRRRLQTSVQKNPH